MISVLTVCFLIFSFFIGDKEKTYNVKLISGIAFTIFLITFLCSIINTSNLFVEFKSEWRKNLIWIFLSILPSIIVLVLTIIGLIKLIYR